MKKKRLLIIICSITLAFILTIIVSNYQSFYHAKEQCIQQGNIPHIERSFLILSWSVSCEK
ncbi:hypothetical protein [Priestia taiwanensis]|uniref:Uncharacterized protein n=1 Tax=Priestia taiwanensis TaxID=1347902 RepID=A0A917AUZ4_9BACI|nr:hypothetical protein [Priestia taiwanensis]MBM7363312.1 hypothetical protein [Priestia taiwanensis]GGE78184.1 hypothetical protein GCM10007140_29800 [Priestia taiwanensis]